MKTRSVVVLALLVVTACWVSPAAWAQSEATNTLPGLAVGTQAPSFTLQDQNGREHTLADLVKQGKVALVFYRSADW